MIQTCQAFQGWLQAVAELLLLTDALVSKPKRVVFFFFLVFKAVAGNYSLP